MRVGITSAAGVVALLDEPDLRVKEFALTKLDVLVGEFWAEISEAIQKIEVLYEDETFGSRPLAALVASKVYYHLGVFEESLQYALAAGDLFNVTESSEYVETLVAKAIDLYILHRRRLGSSGTGDKVAAMDTASVLPDSSAAAASLTLGADPRLEGVVNRMFARCFDDRQYKQAVGIALETQRVDVFEKAIVESDDQAAMLQYSQRVCLSLVSERQFRNTILRVLCDLYSRLPSPDYVSVCQCHIFLDRPQSCAEVLEKLIRGDSDQNLLAYQIGFDLYESATQQFLQKVQDSLKASAPVSVAIGPAQGAKQSPTSTGAQLTKLPDVVAMDESESDKADVKPQETKEEDSSAAIAKKVEGLGEEDKGVQERVSKLYTILGGDTTIELHLQFLIRNNKSDLMILKNTKEGVRNSICHTATVISNAFTHAGTTSDQFLRDNLDWLAKATNWAKFTVTASLGVIHRGHEKDALALMSTYLPKDSTGGSPYSEGGGLFALGLIHANHGAGITEFLLSQLADATNEQVRHGGCLGLGLAAMGTARTDVYEQLKSNLYQDDAVTGEAAGLAMGLVMMGTKSASAIENMVTYAKETQHEKILRGLAIGIALTMYGRLEEADALIDTLSRDKDPILRWSAMYTIAMAYCGSGSNRAIKNLLHVAVSDTNDDVRRAAVTSIGFILFRTPEQCPSVVSLLSESFNPHVRYGAAMALGVACAGTGLKEAVNLLEPMANDPVNYVRQGALISSALVLVQQTESTCPKVKTFRELYATVIADKHEDVMAKFGSIIAQGIIDAGGRNVSVSLQTRTGHTNMQAVVGLLVFHQLWYWFPLSLFLGIAFTPTALIGLNHKLQMPNTSFTSNARPSVYGYPPPLEEKRDKAKGKVEAAVLSITERQQKRKKAQHQTSVSSPAPSSTGAAGSAVVKMEVDEEKKDKEKMDTSAVKTEPASPAAAASTPSSTKKGSAESTSTSIATATEGATTASSAKKEEGTVVKAKEPSNQTLTNPARVMRQQLRVLSTPEDSRYRSVKSITTGGILLLRDLRPSEEESLLTPVAAGGPTVEEETTPEPDPPEPFEWPSDL